MKRFSFFLILGLFSFSMTELFAQSSYASSDPKSVVEKFLELYFKGEWFEAAKKCGTESCSTQIEIMMRKMAMDDVTDESGKCQFIIDSVSIDKNQKNGKAFFTKTCTGLDKPVANHVDVIKINELWYVDYVFKRDKYF